MVAPLHSLDAVSVLVVAEDAPTRSGLIALLTGNAGARVTGGLSPSDLVSSVPTDVYAWDFGRSEEIGLRQFRTHAGTETPALALVGNADQGRAALQAGARGAMLRDGVRDDIGLVRFIAALRACALGYVVTDQLGDSAGPQLTAREGQVIHLLAEGHPNKIIADRLGISEHTAKFHVNALIHKLGAQSRTDVVARAMRKGLLTV